MTTPVRVADLLREAWDLVRADPLPLLGPLVLLGAITGGGDRGPDYRFDRGDPLVLLPFYAFLGLVGLAVAVALFAVHAAAAVTTARAALDRLEGRPADVAASWRALRGDVAPVVLTSALWLLAVLAGLLLFVVPGLVVLAGLFPLPAVVAGEGLRYRAALERAWDLTRGHRWPLFLVGLVLLAGGAVAGVLLDWIPVVGDALGGAAGGAAAAACIVAGAAFHRRAAGGAPGPG